MSCQDLPEDAGELACLCLDLGQPEDRRDRALQKLLPPITRLARRVAAGFPRSFREEFVAQAESVVWERLRHFDPAKGRFEDWCRTVLYHHNVDELRRASAGVVLAAPGGDDPRAVQRVELNAGADADSDQLLDLLRELRRVLDRLSWQPARGVDYFAVLLLQLRLVVARILVAQTGGAEPEHAVPLRELVEWSLPWREEEAAACMKPGWPTLQASWDALCRILKGAHRRIETRMLCDAVCPQLPDARRLSPDVWNHWVNRAKRKARQRLRDPETWERLLGRLLPDR